MFQHSPTLETYFSRIGNILCKAGFILLRMLGFATLAGVVGYILAYANLMVNDPRQPPNPILTESQRMAYEGNWLDFVVELCLGAIAGAAIGLVLGAIRGKGLLLVTGGVLMGIAVAIVLIVLLPLPGPVSQVYRDLPSLYYSWARLIFLLVGAFAGLVLGFNLAILRIAGIVSSPGRGRELLNRR